jgi:DNA-binding MarR family transcriptional regulator
VTIVPSMIDISLALHFISGPEGLPQQQLSESLWIDANNTVLLLNELEREGLIRRERDRSTAGATASI